MPHGEVHLIIGCMFSGKTTELIRRIKRYRIAGKKCVLIKYIEDTRYSGTKACTHDQNMMNALSVPKLASISRSEIQSADIVGIDEGQFFSDIVDFCELCTTMGTTVIVAALDGDYKRRPFGKICELIPKSERVDKLQAICKNCSNNASFTQRKVASSSLKMVGGSELYEAVCRNCHALEPSKKKIKK